MANTTNGLCECGCGRPTNLSRYNDKRLGHVVGQPARFIRGHFNRGRKFPSKDAGKYIGTSVVDGPERNWEHRLIAELVLGRPLPQGAEIHHVDNNGRNNAHTNLVICENRAYHKLLHRRQRVKAAGGNPNTDYICATCGPALHAQFHMRRTGRPSHLCKSCDRAQWLDVRPRRAKLTSAQVVEIRTTYHARKANQYELAREYNVSRGAIQLIVENRTWKAIEA